MGRIGWANKIKGETWGLTLFAVVREMFSFLSLFLFFQTHLHLKLDKMFDCINFPLIISVEKEFHGNPS